MSTFSSPSDVVALTKVRAADINNLDAATAAAFALLPDETKLKLGTVQFAVDTGAADAYLVALTHTPSGYTDGMVVNMRPTNTNTGASTINVNSLGVKSIRHANSAALSAGDIVSGAPVTLIYSTNTGFFHTTGGMGSATAAAASASAASSSASAASTSASDAATALASAQTVYDTFDDRFLGVKAVEPTLDNDGNALATGAMYFNSVSTEMRVYDGAAWQTTYSPGTSASQAEMEAGTEVALRAMSPLRVAQAINALTNINRSARTSNTILAAADRGNLIDITSGTFSQTFTAAATLADGWFCYIRNSGTGIITLEPNGAELIDGLANFEMYSGEARLVICTGTAFYTVVLHPFKLEPAATMAFIEPPGYKAYETFIQAPGGGGGSGARDAAGTNRSGGGGGGAGANQWATIVAGTAGTSITLTVGAAGVGGTAIAVDTTAGNAGTAGGQSSFGTVLIAAGGSAGGAGSLGGNAAGGAASTTPVGMIANAGTAGGTGIPNGASAAGTAASASWAATGGGAGGGIETTNVAHNPAAGGAAGASAAQLAGGIAGVVGGTRPGGNGNFQVGMFRGGSGGGGGAPHATNAGAIGGDGARGGGGGGGSAAINGQASGAGGNGGAAYFYVGGLL
jgi:hypothetical protein